MAAQIIAMILPLDDVMIYLARSGWGCMQAY